MADCSEVRKVSNSTVHRLKRMRRTLFVGPTGIGKSTIINLLVNNNVTVESMSKPAGAGDTSFGQTAFFTTYYDFPNNAYTDSIGLGDNRFNEESIVTSLKSIIKNSSTGYNKIYLCIRYGRISSDTRRYIELLTAIFGQGVLKWCSIIFTNCNDQKMTKELYLTKNFRDTNIIENINQVQTVVFGDNMVDQDPEVDIVFQKRRQVFLNRIQHDINETASTEYFKPESENLLQLIRKIIEIITGVCLSVFHPAVGMDYFIQFTAVSIQSLGYSSYFGECPICSEDMTDGNASVITKCNHVFHKVCIERWLGGGCNKNCPICRAELDGDQKTFYTDLTSDI